MVEDRVFSWYVFGAVVSIISPTLLCLWNLCCQHVTSGMQSWVWQNVSYMYGIEEHQFYNVGNIGAMTRILRQAGLRTGRYRWTHDANAETGDAFQVGSLRLPSHSWCLSFFALLGFTHFIWVKDDGSEIHIIAPEKSITVLLRVSNAAANRPATPEEVQEIRSAFGKDANSLSLFEYRCVCFERLLCLGVCVFADFCLHMIGFPTLLMRVVLVCVDMLTFLFVLYCAFASMCTVSLGGATCCACMHTFNALLRRRQRSEQALHDPAVSEAIVHPDMTVCVHTEVILAVQLSSCADSVDGRALGGSYSIVLPRGKWYEVGAMRPFQRELLQKSPCLSVDIGVCFCTVSCRAHLLSWAAHTFAGEEDLLYVTSHNPMRHLDLVEIKELLGKASRGVALLVVLPPCEYLSSDLQGSENVQNNLGKPWRNVSSLADFSCWLSNLSSGLFHKVVLILPYIHQDRMKDTALWPLLQSHLPQKHILDAKTA